MIEPIVGQLAVHHTRDLAHSALPGAPARHQPHPGPSRPLRRRTAVVLRHLADRLDRAL